MKKARIPALVAALVAFCSVEARSQMTFRPLGDLPGRSFNSLAYGVSADGSLIVGFGTSALGREAFLWTSDAGMQTLRELLIAGGATGLTGWRLTQASAMSADGARSLDGA